MYMVFEMGNVDLANLLKTTQKQRMLMLGADKSHNIGYGLSESQLRFYWEEMLECVKVCHNYNIIHLDLKPANFVSVDGRLKIIDFGIAKQVSTDATRYVWCDV